QSGDLAPIIPELSAVSHEDRLTPQTVLPELGPPTCARNALSPIRCDPRAPASAWYRRAATPALHNNCIPLNIRIGTGMLAWQPTSTSHCSSRARTPGTSGVRGIPRSLRH